MKTERKRERERERERQTDKEKERKRDISVYCRHPDSLHSSFFWSSHLWDRVIHG